MRKFDWERHASEPPVRGSAPSPGRSRKKFAIGGSVVCVLTGLVAIAILVWPINTVPLTYMSERAYLLTPETAADRQYLKGLDDHGISYQTTGQALAIAFDVCSSAVGDGVTFQTLVNTGLPSVSSGSEEAADRWFNADQIVGLRNDNPELDDQAAGQVRDAAFNAYCPDWYKIQESPALKRLDAIISPRKPAISSAPLTPQRASTPPTREFNTHSSDPRIQAWINAYTDWMGGAPYETDATISRFAAQACAVVTTGEGYEEVRNLGMNYYDMGNADSVAAIYATHAVYCSDLPTK
jgi:hypothetical protein